MVTSVEDFRPPRKYRTSEEKEIVESFDEEKVSRLRRKIDFHVVPACALLYLLCFLDRGNIGNAKIAGMNKATGISSYQYSIILTVFFAPYCAFEAPSNAVLKKFSPKYFLPSIAFLWGICILSMGFVRNFGDLVALRVLLGFFECGLMPGCSYYLSNWYRTDEVSYRIALYFSAATIAGAFSGILAFGIMKMDGVGHLAGWSWIFIIEGLLTIVISIISYFIIFNNARTCNFLKENEIIYWEWHLKQDVGKGHDEIDNEPFNWKHIKEGVLQWRVWYMVILSFGCLTPLYAFSYFLPTIIVNLGWKAEKAQLMSVPPYVLACIITVICSYYSDKYKNRSLFIIGSMSLFAITGFAVALFQTNLTIVYVGMFLACTGQYAPWPSIVAWNANNYPNSHVRGIAMGIHIGFSNIGGIIASFIYRKEDAPRYILGNSICLAFVLLTIVMTSALALYYRWLNRKKKLYRERYPEELRNRASMDLAKLGDNNPFFEYQL